jgi:hypothetical protein
VNVEKESLLIFNPHGQEWSGVLPVRANAQSRQALLALVDDKGNPVPAQAETEESGEVTIHVALKAVPPVGYTTLRLDGAPATVAAAPAVHIIQDAAMLHITSGDLAVAIDRSTGNLVHITDLARGEEWGGAHVGQLYALQEAGNDVTLRMADLSPAEQSLTAIEVLQVGPLFAKVSVTKRLLKCDVEQTITVWGSDGRLDLQSRIFWWGARRKQVRMVLPSTPERAAITYGAPFYGVGWNEVAEGTAPRNSDEIAPADQLNYREVQGWLHLAGERGGLTIITDHPAWHYDAGTLAAVLLRTSPSCGDNRLYWENAGEQVFTFTLRLNERNWRTSHVPQQAAAHLRLPAARVIQPCGGDLPSSRSFLQVQGASVALSCLYADSTSGATIARVWETAGESQEITVGGSLSGTQAAVVNLLGETVDSPPAGQPGEWKVALPAWSIRTIRFCE